MGMGMAGGMMGGGGFGAAQNMYAMGRQQQQPAPAPAAPAGNSWTCPHRLLRSSCRCRHCLLWPDNLSRPRSAPYMPWTLPYVQSCYDTSGIVAWGRFVGIAM